MIGVHLGEARDLVRLVLMMRQAVVRLVHAHLRIRTVVQIARHHEGEDAGDVRLKRQRHQVEHQADMGLVHLGGTDRRLGHLEVRPRLLLRPDDAAFDLAHVVQIFAEARLVAGAKPLLQSRRRLRHRIEDAASRTHPLEPLPRRAGAAEHALEHDARIDLHRQRRGRPLPRDGVHVGAAVADVAGADKAGEVLGGDFERGERRILPDRLRDHLVDGGLVADIHPLGLLGRDAGKPHRRRGRVPARRRILRAIQAAHDTHLIAEALERLQDRRELEPRALRRRRPLRLNLAVRHVDRSEAPHRRSGGPRLRCHRRHHRVEQRERERDSHPSQERSAWQRAFADQHHGSPGLSDRRAAAVAAGTGTPLALIWNGTLLTTPSTTDVKR